MNITNSLKEISNNLFSSTAHSGASTTRKSLRNYLPSLASSDVDDLPELPELKARTRDLYRNSPYGRGAINVNVANVIGTGLKMQSRIDADYLGKTKEEANNWQKNTEREFNNFTKNKNFDTRGVLNFYDMQDLVFRNVLMSGEVLCLLPYRKRNKRKYELTCQVIEADHLGNDYGVDIDDKIIDGIEFDKYGSPIAYWISTKNPNDTFSLDYKRVDRFGKKSGRTNVLHLFFMERPSQKRGIPYLAPVIEILKQISRLSESELMASVIQSMFTAFIKSPAGTSGINLPGGENDAEGEVSLGNGVLMQLAPGEEIETAQPQRPNAQFDVFMKSFIDQVGTALSIPYEILAMQFKASYSASKAALLQAWTFFKGKRSWVIGNYCDPVYKEFMFESVAKGYISAPGFFEDEDIQEAYLKNVWIGQGMGQIDPVKDTNGAILRVKEGFSTRASESAMINGTDFDTNVEQLSKENQKMSDLGLSVENEAVDDIENDNDDDTEDETLVKPKPDTEEENND